MAQNEQVLLIDTATASMSPKTCSEKFFMPPRDTGLQGPFQPMRAERRTQDGSPLAQLELENLSCLLGIIS